MRFVTFVPGKPRASTAPCYRPRVELLEDRTLLSFLPPRVFPAGVLPYGVAAGDLRGDGTSDLAVADRGDSFGRGTGVSVLLGNGNGTFRAPVLYPAGPNPESVAIGDFNGDGIPDLAVGNAGTAPLYNDGSVSILLGNGDGTFQPAASYPVGNFPMSIAVGDFAGNGVLDLAVANADSSFGGTVSVLLGRGDGTFLPALQFYTLGRVPVSVTVGDLDGDGVPDLVVPNLASNTVSVLRGEGNGFFRPGVTYAAGIQPQSVAVGDFNGDGIPDIGVVDYGDDPGHTSGVSILLGNGDGTFAPPVFQSFGYTPEFIAAADFTGDGCLDLAVADVGSRAVHVLLGNGDGTFQAPLTYQVAQYPTSIAVADFTGNGLPDLVVNNLGTGTVSVLLNAGDWNQGQPGAPSRAQVPTGHARARAHDRQNVDPALAEGAAHPAQAILQPAQPSPDVVVGPLPRDRAPTEIQAPCTTPSPAAPVTSPNGQDAVLEAWRDPLVDALALTAPESGL